MTDFSLQQHLNDMEDRIHKHIESVEIHAREAASSAAVLAVSVEAVKGRVTSLEEKASWVIYVLGCLIVSACGFVWHVLTGK